MYTVTWHCRMEALIPCSAKLLYTPLIQITEDWACGDYISKRIKCQNWPKGTGG